MEAPSHGLLAVDVSGMQDLNYPRNEKTKTATFVYLPTLVNLFLLSMQLSHKSCPRLYIYDTSHSTCHAFITWFQLSLTIHIYCVKCLCWKVLLFVSFMTSTSSFLGSGKKVVSFEFWSFCHAKVIPVNHTFILFCTVYIEFKYPLFSFKANIGPYCTTPFVKLLLITLGCILDQQYMSQGHHHFSFLLKHLSLFS